MLYALCSLLCAGAAYAELAAKSYAIGMGNSFDNGLLLLANEPLSFYPYSRAYTDGIGAGNLIMMDDLQGPQGEKCLRTNARGEIEEDRDDCNALSINGVGGNMVKIGSKGISLLDAGFPAAEVTLRNKTGQWTEAMIPLVGENGSVNDLRIESIGIKFGTGLVGSESGKNWLFPLPIPAGNFGCLRIDNGGIISATGSSCGDKGALTFEEIHDAAPDDNNGKLISAQTADIARGKLVNSAGSASAYTTASNVAGIPTSGALPTGTRIFMKMNVSNNVGKVTLNVNGLGAKNIVVNGSTSLTAGMLKIGGIYMFVYEGLEDNGPQIDDPGDINIDDPGGIDIGGGLEIEEPGGGGGRGIDPGSNDTDERWHAISVGGDTTVTGLNINGTGGIIVEIGANNTIRPTIVGGGGVYASRVIRKTTSTIASNRLLVTSGTAGEVVASNYIPADIGTFTSVEDCGGNLVLGQNPSAYWTNIFVGASCSQPPPGGMLWNPVITCRRSGNVVSVAFYYDDTTNSPNGYCYLNAGETLIAKTTYNVAIDSGKRVFCETRMTNFSGNTGQLTYIYAYIDNSKQLKVWSPALISQHGNGGAFQINCTFMVNLPSSGGGGVVGPGEDGGGVVVGP